MGFDIQSMIGTYKDFMRSYLFYAKITSAPTGVNLPPKHEFLVNATSLPTQTIEPITTDWQGHTYKMGGTTTFEDFTITFRADPTHDLRAAFLQWMHLVHNPATNIHGNPADYFGQIALDHLNTNGEAQQTYNLIQCFPITVGELSLDYTAKDVSTFDVTFSYQYHYINGIGGQGATETGAA